MNDEENLDVIFGEFMDDEETIHRQIEAEWDERYERGEEIYVGEASNSVYLRWLQKQGLELFAILRRKGWIVDTDDEEEEDSSP